MSRFPFQSPFTSDFNPAPEHTQRTRNQDRKLHLEYQASFQKTRNLLLQAAKYPSGDIAIYNETTMRIYLTYHAESAVLKFTSCNGAYKHDWDPQEVDFESPAFRHGFLMTGERTLDVAAQKLGIKPGQPVLDIETSFGHSSRYLHLKYGASMTRARVHKLAHNYHALASCINYHIGLLPHINSHKENFADLNWKGGQFDHIISLMNLASFTPMVRASVLRIASHHLKPRGKMFLEEFCLAREPDDYDEDEVRVLRQVFGQHAMEMGTAEDLSEKLKVAAGFKFIQFEDVSHEARSSVLQLAITTEERGDERHQKADESAKVTDESPNDRDIHISAALFYHVIALLLSNDLIHIYRATVQLRHRLDGTSQGARYAAQVIAVASSSKPTVEEKGKEKAVSPEDPEESVSEVDTTPGPSSKAKGKQKATAASVEDFNDPVIRSMRKQRIKSVLASIEELKFSLSREQNSKDKGKGKATAPVAHFAMLEVPVELLPPERRSKGTGKGTIMAWIEGPEEEDPAKGDPAELDTASKPGSALESAFSSDSETTAVAGPSSKGKAKMDSEKKGKGNVSASSEIVVNTEDAEASKTGPASDPTVIGESKPDSADRVLYHVDPTGNVYLSYPRGDAKQDEEEDQDHETKEIAGESAKSGSADTAPHKDGPQDSQDLAVVETPAAPMADNMKEASPASGSQPVGKTFEFGPLIKAKAKSIIDALVGATAVGPKSNLADNLLILAETASKRNDAAGSSTNVTKGSDSGPRDDGVSKNVTEPEIIGGKQATPMAETKDLPKTSPKPKPASPELPSEPKVASKQEGMDLKEASPLIQTASKFQVTLEIQGDFKPAPVPKPDAAAEPAAESSKKTVQSRAPEGAPKPEATL